MEPNPPRSGSESFNAEQRQALEEVLDLSLDDLDGDEVQLLRQLAGDMHLDHQRTDRLRALLHKHSRPGLNIESLHKALHQAGERRDGAPFGGGMARVTPLPTEAEPDRPAFPIDDEPVNLLPESSSPNLPSRPRRVPLPNRTGSREESRTNAPAKLVERFISCWNQKAFGVEYDCYETGRLGIDRETYADRRMAVWLPANRTELTITQELGHVLMAKVAGKGAQVLCTRILSEANKRTVYLEMYELRLQGADWRIHSVDAGIASDDLMAHHMKMAQKRA